MTHRVSLPALTTGEWIASTSGWRESTMLCWWMVGVLALLETAGFAGRFRRRRRRGTHRGRDRAAMREWPGDKPT